MIDSGGLAQDMLDCVVQAAQQRSCDALVESGVTEEVAKAVQRKKQERRTLETFWADGGANVVSHNAAQHPRREREWAALDNRVGAPS